MKIGLKKLFCAAVLLACYFRSGRMLAFAQNLIRISQYQKNLIKLPKKLERKFELEQFAEAFQFYAPQAELQLKGNYVIFAFNSDSKSQTEKSTSSKSPSYLSQMIYVSADSKKYSDILYISEEEYYIPKITTRDYFQFDDNGNAFIIVEHYPSNRYGILMYSPSQDSRTFFPMTQEFPVVSNFAISNNGKFLVVNGSTAVEDPWRPFDIHNAFIFNTEYPEQEPELVFEKRVNLSAIIYSPQAKAFYMVAYNNDFAGVVVLRSKNNIYSKQSAVFYDRANIIQGNMMDYTHIILLCNETDQNIYFVNNNIEHHYGAKICRIIDAQDSIEFKELEPTRNIILDYTTANYYKVSLRSTPLGLFILDRNDKAYLYIDGEVQETTEGDVLFQTQSYYADLLKKNFVTESNLQIQNLKLKVFILYSVLGLFITCAILFFAIYFSSQKKLQQKTLQKKMLAFQEVERAKLSRDIHDSIVQDIRAIRLQAELIDVGQDEKAIAQKARVIDDITQTIVKTRNICYNLTPAELMTHSQGDDAEIELISIIDSLCHQFYVKSKIPCAVQVAPELIYPKFEKEVTLHLVRIFQEILNNIEKHSYATNVNVLVRNKTEGEQNYIVLFVIDDGIGCNIEEVLKNRRKNHFGLQNMQERMELVGGSIEFFSAENEGMKIKLTVKI